MAEADSGFLLMFEYGVGGEIDGDNLSFRPGRAHNSGGNDPAYTCSTDHLPLAKNLEIGNSIRFWANDDDLGRVERNLAEGYGAMVDIWFDYRKYAPGKGKSAREYCDETVDRCREMVKKYGSKVWFNIYPEVDNHAWLSRPGKFANRQEAFRDLALMYEKELGFFPSAGGGDELISPFQYLKERGIKSEEINMVALCCQMFSPHLLYKLGANAVWPEGNVGNSHQLTIAFARGAARQYGRKWCYDVAPFDCQGSEVPMAYDTRHRRFSGFSESYILRSWLVSYLSGASTFLFQLSDQGFFVRHPDNRLELSPIGGLGRDFADFALKRHPNRGEMRVPIALMLSQDHGYTSADRDQARLFWRKVPDDSANKSIEAFFRLAFPGCENTNGYSFETSRWAPGGSRKNQQPWIKPEMSSREDFAQFFHEAVRDRTVDQRPLEKAFLTESTWGDSFDVLVDNAPLEVLQKYKGIILLGSISLSAELRQKLKAYVENGGKVLLNIAHVSPEDQEWLGVKFCGKAKSLHHSYSLLTNRLFCEGEYEYTKLELGGAEPLIKAGFVNTSEGPLVTRRRVGKGEVWFTAAEHYQAPEKQNLTWMEAIKESADEFIRPGLDLEVDGDPVEWMINDAGGGSVWVTLINNNPRAWEGRVILKDNLVRATARDIWNEKSVMFEYDESGRIVLKPTIAPWDFKVIEIKAG